MSTFVDMMGGRSQTFEQIKVQFITLIRATADEPYIDMLLAIYALSPDYCDIRLLSDRRKKFGIQIDRKIDTIADREVVAIKTLAEHLAWSYDFGEVLSTNFNFPNCGLLRLSLSVNTIVRDSQIIEYEHVHKFITLTDKVRYFVHSNMRLTDLVASVEAGRVLSYDLGWEKYKSYHKVNLYSLELRRGHFSIINIKETPFEISRHAPSTSTKKIKQDYSDYFFDIPTIHYKQTVTFIGNFPEVIWWYENIPDVCVPASISQPWEGSTLGSNLIQISERGSVEHEFRDLYTNHCGIAWRWKDAITKYYHTNYRKYTELFERRRRETNR